MMSKHRYWQLMYSSALPELTENEIAHGYHFCPEWDELLIGPDDPEWEACTCDLGKR